jgi:YgiT-type zinc finger domain-containing protein
MEHQLKCPVCGSEVLVQHNPIEGTVKKGGHNTVSAEDSAVCGKCGRQFTQPEIDDLGSWR